METKPEFVGSQDAVHDASAGLLWYDLRQLGMEGQAWTDAAHPYDRLPARARELVPAPVYELARHSAGLAARFVTDSPLVSVRWTLRFETLAMPHMPATGVSGVDLYARFGRVWRWAGLGLPQQFPHNQTGLLNQVGRQPREYRLYLPLYNGVERVEIGLAPDAYLSKAAALPHTRAICVYGTSIDQGGCASRPGMAWTAIAGRQLDVEFINLGFSGNGRLDYGMADLLGELDAAVYVLNCVANMDLGLVTERTAEFVTRFRRHRPTTPMVLVSQARLDNDRVETWRRQEVAAKNAALLRVFQELTNAGDGNLYWLDGSRLLGGDRENTVDGIHPTDLGFLRMARAFMPVLRRLLSGAGQ